MMYWHKAGSENGAAKFISSHQMQLLVTNAAVLIMPAEETDDFFDATDMMTTAVFAYTLYGLLRGKKQGREIICHFFSKEDAAWFLGFLGLDRHDETAVAEIVKMAVKHEKFRCDRNCFCCPLPDCTLRGDAGMTEFEILCMEIAHPNENPETVRQRRNSRSLERYYQKKARKSKG